MSGFEVAGLVLGAFPIVISALKSYEEVARRMGFWFEIRSEYQKCYRELRFHRVTFTRNLKQLLLPLGADEEEVKRLLASPGIESWKGSPVADALESRLHDSYCLYLEIIEDMSHALDQLNQQLATDAKNIQCKVAEQKVSNTHTQHSLSINPNSIRSDVDSAKNTTRPEETMRSKVKRSLKERNREYQVYRVKFSLGENTRKRLFEELQTYNDRLEKLLSTGDIVSTLNQSTHNALKATSTSIDSTLCKFWYSADRLYRALLAAWNCGCYHHHHARLILQHRMSTKEKEFSLILDSDISQGSQEWPRCKMKIEEKETLETSSRELAISKTAMPTFTPNRKSTMQGQTAISRGDVNDIRKRSTQMKRQL